MGIEFEGKFDWVKFQQCVQYVQDSLDWLTSEAEKHRSSTISVFPPGALHRTVTTLRDLMRYRQHYMHNEQTRINRLPSETLGRVFLYLMDPPTRLPHPDTGYVEISRTGEWSQASLVCRYWRQVVLSTPELWTMIRVSYRMKKRTVSWPWASLKLSRSGMLPITLELYTACYKDDIPQEDMSRLVDEAHRINELRLTRHINLQYFKPILVKALRLETLLIMEDKPNNHPARGEFPCHFPHLRTLSVLHRTFWRSWSMRELRHLSLVNQEWKSADVRGFVAVLEASAHLEELFLERIRVHSWDDWSNVSAYIEKLPPVHLSKLKRLFIQDNFENVNMPTPMIATVHQKLELPTNCTRFNVFWPILTHDEPVPFDRRGAYPVARLFITAGFLTGTDGTSLCIIVRSETDTEALRSIHLSQVRELWLDTPTWDMGTPRSVAPAASAVQDMQNVTKLALLRESSFWMEQLVDSFPALTELHIFTQYCPDGPAIVRFLASRKQRDLKVRTLYFFGDQASKHCRDFVKWKESPQEFSCHVERVVFEETPFRLYGRDLLSEKFGIPEACEASSGSPVSKVWQPWKAFCTLGFTPK